MLWLGLGGLLGAVAHASVPDHIAARFNLIDGRSLKRLDVSDDERVVVGVGGDGRVVLLDAESWVTAKASVCNAKSVAIADRASRSDYLLYVGCADGTLHTLRWSGSALSTLQVDGAAEVIELAQNPLIGAWRSTSGVIYALAEASGDAQHVHSYDPSTGAVDTATAAGAELLRRDFREGVIARSASGDIIYVAHGGNDFTQIQIGSGLTLPNAQLSRAVEVEDITLAPSLSGLPTGVWISDPDNGLLQWNGSSGLGAAVSITTIDGSLGDLRAALVQYNEAHTAVESVILHQRGSIKAVPQAVLGQTPLAEFDVGFDGVDMVEGPYGYVIVGTDDGALVVLTANPWVDELTLSPSEGEVGTVVTASFTTDTAGSWKLLRGGTRSGDGVVIASGSVDAPGQVQATFTVDSSFTEGETAIYARVSDADGAGHARAAFLIDNPPLQVSLGSTNVGFGDGELLIDFAALTAVDIDHYDLYISTEQFSASDYPTGGPESSEPPRSPREVSAEEGESRVQTRIGNLDNNVSYYIAVRAVDTQGTEGPMSQVVVGMPRQTFTSAERVADPGGSACSSSPGPGGAAGALAGLVALAAIGRRRPALAALALIAASGVARAQEPIERKRGLAQFNRDITPVWASFQLRHDFQHFGFQRASSTTQANAWDTLQTAYAPWVSVLRIEAGPQIFRVAEINFGLGFMTHKGYTLDSANNPSSEAARLQWLPLSIGGTLRAHILDEQPLVPFAGAGVDWVFYREDQLDTDGLADKTQRLVGSKNGWHWFVGGAILLDSFAPSRAARMEALTGINDSWLTIEYRAQEVGPNGGGFDFSGWALGIGLKLDY